MGRDLLSVEGLLLDRPREDGHTDPADLVSPSRSLDETLFISIASSVESDHYLSVRTIASSVRSRHYCAQNE
jgi:hypothetical protein